MSGEIEPALSRYREVLAAEILPRARSAGEVGLGSLPDGDACYRALIRDYTGLDDSADDLHELGVQEVEQTTARMRKLGQELFGTGSLAAVVDRLI